MFGEGQEAREPWMVNTSTQFQGGRWSQEEMESFIIGVCRFHSETKVRVHSLRSQSNKGISPTLWAARDFIVLYEIHLQCYHTIKLSTGTQAMLALNHADLDSDTPLRS